jgi:hypothetical protein
MGSAWADYDNDGDVDLYTARNNYFGGASCLYRNDGNGNHWLSVRCVGTVSNRAGIGARIDVKASINGRDVWQRRDISTQTGGGNSGGSDLRVSFGLANAAVVESLIARWPSGRIDRLTGVAADQHLTVVEGASGVEERARPVSALATGQMYDVLGRRASPVRTGVYLRRDTRTGRAAKLVKTR